MLKLSFEDVLSVRQTNRLTQQIFEFKDFWQDKYQQDFDSKPISEETYREACKNRFYYYIDNLKVRIGYEIDYFEYLVDQEYYSDDLVLEEEPGEEYYSVDPFTVNPNYSKVIGILFWDGGIEPMMLQEYNGQLIEISERTDYQKIAFSADNLSDSIQVIYILEVPGKPFERDGDMLTPFPLKDPDHVIMEELYALGKITSLDDILNVSSEQGESVLYDIN